MLKNSKNGWVANSKCKEGGVVVNKAVSDPSANDDLNLKKFLPLKTIWLLLGLGSYYKHFSSQKKSISKKKIISPLANPSCALLLTIALKYRLAS